MVLELKNEPSKNPRLEYINGIMRIQIDYMPKSKEWRWCLESDNNGPVYWHATADKPSFEDVKAYMRSKGWAER